MYLLESPLNITCVSYAKKGGANVAPLTSTTQDPPPCTKQHTLQSEYEVASSALMHASMTCTGTCMNEIPCEMEQLY